MSFKDLFHSGGQNRNLSHFAAIANIATIDGILNEKEELLLKRFARKLDIHEDEYNKVLADPSKFPFDPQHTSESRLERLHDLFKMIFADHNIDDDERVLVERYAVGLGFKHDTAIKIIAISSKIFQGEIDFEDYMYLLKKSI